MTRAIIFALLLFIGPQVQAQSVYQQVPGTPITIVQGVKVGVWAFLHPLGYAIGVFEQKPDGQWIAVGLTPFVSNLQSAVDAAGGASQYVAAVAPILNAALARRFSVSTTGPTATGDQSVDAVNQALYAGYTLSVGTDGTVALSRK